MIDCHVHFSGSIPIDFTYNIIKERNLGYLAQNRSQIETAIKYTGDDGFAGFLHCFKLYDEMPWDEDIIIRSIEAVCQKIEEAGTAFVWMDFSINKYMSHLKWHKADVIRFFNHWFNVYLPNRIALILSIKMESLEASKRQYLDLIDIQEVQDSIAGIDLVGDERYFNAEFYKPYFEKWANHGKLVRVHVGEVGRLDNVRQALKKLPITNIAHGIDIIHDKTLMDLAKKRDIQFDLALTSNLLIRKDIKIENHPIHIMIQEGLKCTLGSDDPVIFDTCIDNEFNLVPNGLRDLLIKNSYDFTRSYGYLL